MQKKRIIYSNLKIRWHQGGVDGTQTLPQFGAPSRIKRPKSNMHNTEEIPPTPTFKKFQKYDFFYGMSPL